MQRFMKSFMQIPMRGSMNSPMKSSLMNPWRLAVTLAFAPLLFAGCTSIQVWLDWLVLSVAMTLLAPADRRSTQS